MNPITVRSDSAAIRLSALAAAAITHRSFCAALCASPQQGADSFFSVEGCVEDEDNVTISTFRAGKGAAFWGPFTNQELRLLSGHKREDTLPRYLGWGRFSADALRAAVARDRRVEGGAAQHEPAKMGLFSGRGGDKGRRVQTPPDAGRPFLPQRPPKAAEEAATWELKAKKVDTLDWRRVRAAIGSVDCNRDAAFDKQLGNDLLGAWT